MFSKKWLCHPQMVEPALALLRVALGIAFVYHGYGKILSPERWAWLGAQRPLLGTETLAPFWGFMAAFSEFGGGVMLVLGRFVRPATLLIGSTMTVACMIHYQQNEGFELPLMYLILCIVVCLAGPDSKCMDYKCAAKC